MNSEITWSVWTAAAQSWRVRPDVLSCHRRTLSDSLAVLMWERGSAQDRLSAAVEAAQLTAEAGAPRLSPELLSDPVGTVAQDMLSVAYLEDEPRLSARTLVYARTYGSHTLHAVVTALAVTVCAYEAQRFG